MSPIISTDIDSNDLDRSIPQYYHTKIYREDQEEKGQGMLEDWGFEVFCGIIQMKQQSQSLQIAEHKTITLALQIPTLYMEVMALEQRVSILVENTKKEKQLNQAIELLQNQSQEHYETLRKLSVEYSEHLTTYSSKIDIKSQDICDERDRTESNIYYLEAENSKLKAQCERKLQQRKKLQEEIEQYHQKKQKLASILIQENIQVSQKIRVNKQIEERIKQTREENEHYQEEIFNADIRAENLKKYGYEVVPQKIAHLMEGKEQVQKEIQELQYQKERQMKIIGKLVNIEIADKGREALQAEREKRSHFGALKKENIILKEENERLNAIKYKYEWNPNMEIKQLEENYQQEEMKISNIEKEISAIKKKYQDMTQKIKEYSDYAETIEPKLDGYASPLEELDSPRKLSKDKNDSKKQKIKTVRPTLFQQIKNDLQQRSFRQTNWRDFFRLKPSEKENNSLINLSQNTYKVHKPSQKISILVTLFFLICCSYICHKYYRK